VSDLKINVPDTLVSVLLVILSFCAVFVLAMLQVGQAIWGRRSARKIVNDPDWLKARNIQCTIHERPIEPKSWQEQTKSKKPGCSSC